MRVSAAGGTEAKTANYTVKNIELVLAGSDVQARVFTLAPGESIPWHYHSQITDHYFILQGVLSITTRGPNEDRALGAGERHRIPPGAPHLLANRGTAECTFLNLQGVGTYDWIKADG